jgi:uncharacterized protein (DUF2235 family)
MPKNIVICCDGTGNKLDVCKSNVVRLFSILRRDDPASQVALYDPGVGTMAPAAALTSVSRVVTKLAGGAVGFGLLDNVAEMYGYLMDHFDEGDTVFLFGFSRGAFTVRTLAGLLRRCHLLKPEFKNLVPYALDLYRPHVEKTAVIEEFRSIFSRPCPVHFLGLWDTVKAFGYLWPKSLPHLRFNDAVSVVRHALALEERRAFFAPTSWFGVDSDSDARTLPSGQNVLEVWFAGCHSDVGGGASEAAGSLYKWPLEWMVREAEQHGLQIDEPQLKAILARPAGPPRKVESLTRRWWPAECVPRFQLLNHYSPPKRRPTIGLARGRALSEFVRNGALIAHESVPEELLQSLARRTGTTALFRPARESTRHPLLPSRVDSPGA